MLNNQRTTSDYTGTGVDIYILVEGIDHENKEFGGRAFDGGFMPIQSCTEIGTHLASLAAGRHAGVAKNANIYRYILLTAYIWLATYTFMLMYIVVGHQYILNM